MCLVSRSHLGLWFVALLLAGGHVAAASEDTSAQPHQQKEEQDVKKAVELRDKPGASPREQKEALSLLRDAAGLVSSPHGSVQQAAAEGSQSSLLPVPGFPEYSFKAEGSPAALRELAKSYQRGKGVDVNHKLALELFRRAAERGDPEAQGYMGMRMSVGLHYHNSFEGGSIRQFGRPDEAGAILHYYFGAANGDMFSSAALGYRHTFGLGVPKSCWTAVSYYRPVAEAVVQEAVEGAKAGGPLGSSSGRGLPQIERIRLNVHANQGIKPDRQREVLQYYQYSADRGNIDAQTAVGMLLNIGTHGVTRDHVAAAHYLQRAADAGSDEAMAHLGHMYGAGLGVPQDPAKALKFFRQAVKKQNPLGLYGLGYMYLSGTAVEQDYEAAHQYLKAAAEAGDRDAHFYMGAMHMHGLGMRRKSLTKAFMHYLQAAQLGHLQAQYNVAMMYLSGKGTQRSCKPALSQLKSLVEKGPLAAALQAGHEAFFRGHLNQALLLYLKASEFGMEIAQSNAAWMLERGFSHAGPLAASVATSLYRRSAEQGNVVSLLQLGDCYYYGSGVDQDWVRASAIYYEAYKQSSAEAMFNLGFMHEYGAGVPQDMSLALRFYNMAKHTNADAALPVYLARTWLKVHQTWEWLRPMLPDGVAKALDWMFVLRPAKTTAAGRLWTTSSGFGQLPGPEALSPAVSGMLPAASDPSASGGSTSSTAGSAAGAAADGGADRGSSSQGSRSWFWPPALSAELLAWQWDGFMWRLTEAAGLAGLSVSSIMEEYSDFGETLLLLVLLAVLMTVLHIRRQRQLALQNRVMAALAQPDQQQQLMAQQIATQLGLRITPQQAAAAASAAAAGSAQQGAVAAAPPPATGVAAAAVREPQQQQAQQEQATSQGEISAADPLGSSSSGSPQDDGTQRAGDGAGSSREQ